MNKLKANLSKGTEIKKSRREPTFFFGQTFKFLKSKSTDSLQIKNNKNKFASSALFDPKTTNQFSTNVQFYLLNIN